MGNDKLNTKVHSVVIALVERSAGNSEVGDMWTEAKSFSLDAPIKDVIDWAHVRCSGRLTLTLDQASEPPDSHRG